MVKSACYCVAYEQFETGIIPTLSNLKGADLSNSGIPGKTIVLGTGNFGTCLANHLAQKGHSVTIWGRSQEIVDSINTLHRNPKYLEHIALDHRLNATLKLEPESLKAASFLVLAIPTQSLRSVMEPIKDLISPSCIIVCAVKGIENDTYRFPIQIVEDVLGPASRDKIVVLSGPSFAIEVAEKQPTAVSVACRNAETNRATQALFHTSLFRVYTTDDPIGLEVAGALKNVIAIASGTLAGLGFQQNARAALLTRGLAEIARVGAALGANPITFMGLGGVGDLFLTCTSEKSRNYTVGYRLGKGESLDEVLRTLGSVAEGVSTSKAAYELCEKLKVDSPIIHVVYSVLYGGDTVANGLHRLLNREMKAEISNQ
ncbi:MAG: NAD(P)-dependent glycerol-3-phosphate dehydrogenase [Chitinophagaceae bacterium]|nr:NAD(P)-dependent glycerol-3-phosphate dehydrogenase [Oligoflexus sp.]